MSLGLQAKLLRVIQERRVRRVGAMKEHAMDLRLISSVNEDPHEAAERGGLRHDLLHRLGVMVIRIPPLRERMGDLEKLIRHFLHKHNAPLKKQISAISADVLDLFHNYRWPGNVRELEHAIEGAAIQVQGNEAIDLRHLPDHITRQAAPPPGGRFAPASGPPLEERINVIFSPEGSAPEAAAPAAGMALTEIQAANERRTICKMLARFQGNASRAARELALSPQLLHYKMKKHRIRRKDFLP
jgi:arginine utilization regulatory protein